MYVTVLGAGVVGKAIVYDLATMPQISNITIVDINRDNIEGALTKVSDKSKIYAIASDVFSDKAIDAIKKSDLVFSALPGSISYNVIKQLIKYRKHIIDVSFMDEDVLELDSLAKENNVILIPDAGFAPGLTNLIVGYNYFNVFDKLERVDIHVGALPAWPAPPLNHVITWSVEDFLDEYLRMAKIVQNGKVELIDPLSVTNSVLIEGIGQFEEFYTDGLRTLISTIPVKDMAEKTLRYPGHIAKMKFLKQLGLLSNKKINVDSFKIAPRYVLEKILARLKEEDILDIVVMRIDLSGYVNSKFKTYMITLYEQYSQTTKFSAIARVTGFTATAVSKLLIDEKIDSFGVIPLELIGQCPNLYNTIINYLRDKHNIKLNIYRYPY